MQSVWSQCENTALHCFSKEVKNSSDKEPEKDSPSVDLWHWPQQEPQTVLLNPSLKTSLFSNFHFIILNSLKSCNYKEFSLLSTISVVQHNYLIMIMCHKDTKAHDQFDRSTPAANLIKTEKMPQCKLSKLQIQISSSAMDM